MGGMATEEQKQLAQALGELAEGKANEQVAKLAAVVAKLADAMQKANNYSLRGMSAAPNGEAEWQEAQRLLKRLQSE
jgi:hypothetical protein